MLYNMLKIEEILNNNKVEHKWNKWIMENDRHWGSRAQTWRVIRKDHFGENKKKENNKK